MSYINSLRALNIVGLLAVIVINTLANALPINGQTTGEISAAYANLFTPAGFIFSIWLVIYTGLAGFCFYQLEGSLIYKKQQVYLTSQFGLAFFISCAANVAWIFSWHYEYFAVSVLFMVLLLLSLIAINGRVHKLSINSDRNIKFRWLVRVPFGLYLGWICIALIANVSVYLTYLNWDGLGISNIYWAIVMIVTGAIIGSWLLARMSLISAAIAILWGIIGIYVEQWQNSGSYKIMGACAVLGLMLMVGIGRKIRRMRRLSYR